MGPKKDAGKKGDAGGSKGGKGKGGGGKGGGEEKEKAAPKGNAVKVRSWEKLLQICYNFQMNCASRVKVMFNANLSPGPSHSMREALQVYGGNGKTKVWC